MEKKLDLIINMIKDQDKKIDSLKEEMNERYDSLMNETNERYDFLMNETNEKYNRLELNQKRIEEKLDNLSNQVTVLEDYAHEKCEGALDGWLSHLEKQEEIKNNVTNLNSKTENHEIRISVLEDVLEA